MPKRCGKTLFTRKRTALLDGTRDDTYFVRSDADALALVANEGTVLDLVRTECPVKPSKPSQSHVL